MKNIRNRITILWFVALLFGFSAWFLLTPAVCFSEQENRSLRTLPHFSWERLASGEYSSNINDYFADQFPARDLFVGIKAISEISLGKGENNGVLLGKNGQLAQRLFDVVRHDGTVLSDVDWYDDSFVAQALEGIARAAERSSVPFGVMLTGRTLDITASDFSYPNESSKRLQDLTRERIGSLPGYIDTISPLTQKHLWGEYVSYKTDHHWTTLGAYYAYAQAMRSFGMEEEILPASAFEKVLVSNDFYGTLWSKSGLKFVPPDSIEFWLLGNESEFSVIADGTPINGFYSKEYLEKKDQYSAFLDGTHDVVRITKKDGESRPVLLLLKDSFANSLAPFLAQHFDLILLNLSSARSDFTNVTELSLQYNADRVLLVYTLENVIGATKLQKLH